MTIAVAIAIRSRVGHSQKAPAHSFPPKTLASELVRVFARLSSSYFIHCTCWNEALFLGRAAGSVRDMNFAPYSSTW
jgi:hypothetical protein